MVKVNMKNDIYIFFFDKHDIKMIFKMKPDIFLKNDIKNVYFEKFLIFLLN